MNDQLTMHYRSINVAAALLVLSSCAHTPPKTALILGTWNGVSQNASGSSFQFRSDKSATWNLGQSFEIQYEIDDQSTPTKLDLFGFQVGSLRGRTLLCIVEFSENTLRMDCEPTERPTSFNPEQTQVFSRDRDGV